MFHFQVRLYMAALRRQTANAYGSERLTDCPRGWYRSGKEKRLRGWSGERSRGGGLLCRDHEYVRSDGRRRRHKASAAVRYASAVSVRIRRTAAPLHWV